MPTQRRRCGISLRLSGGRLRQSQRGVVVVLVAVGMVALIMMAGLALDTGHMLLNKTRLQNAADAAALAAAKALDESGNIALATAEALQAFGSNASASGSGELNSAYDSGNGAIQVTVEYSSTLPPFTPGSAAGPFVRVRATGFVMPAWLVRVGGIFTKTVAATAVAGPRTLTTGSTVCNLAPMMICGTPGATHWGYTLDAPVVLKKSTAGGQTCGSSIGPGNFQLIQLGGSGANIVRQNMAGSYDACIAGGSTMQTQTGNEAGPVAQGLNTRFGDYSGPMNGSQSQYPPDVITKYMSSPKLSAQCNTTLNRYEVKQGDTVVTSSNIDLAYSYQEYSADLTNPANYDYQPINDGGTGAYERRILAVPVGDCSSTSGGQGSVSLLGFACFFLLQPAEQQGNDSYVYGQFIEGCEVTGTAGPNPEAGSGPHIIQLYHDPGSGDS